MGLSGAGLVTLYCMLLGGRLAFVPKDEVKRALSLYTTYYDHHHKHLSGTKLKACLDFSCITMRANYDSTNPQDHGTKLDFNCAPSLFELI